MIVTNNSLKIIGVGETSILPGETAALPAGYEKNPVVLRYIARGIFSTTEPDKKKKGVQKNAGSDKVDDSVKATDLAKGDDSAKAATDDASAKK